MLLRHGREVNISCHGGAEKLLCGGFIGAENSRLAPGKGLGRVAPPPHPDHKRAAGNQIAGGGGSKSTAFIGLFNFPKTNLNLVGPF